jgi:D-3-phosphoglycerate dehydrogenase
MKILAVADQFFTRDLIEIATAPAREAGESVEVRQWSFPSRTAQQQFMLAVERDGPGAAPAPPDLAEPFDHELLIAQFAPLSAETLARGSRLRAVVVNRAGLENVDVEAATAQGIGVINVPSRNTDAVAEFTVGLILAETRNIARSHAALKAGCWKTEFPTTSRTSELRGKVIALVGYGRIGKLVQQMLAGFGCQFVVFDPYLAAPPKGARQLDLESALRSADVVSLHARLTPDSRHLIGETELRLLKPTCVLVNTARAGLIDEAALCRALDEGRLGGAALDVYEHEPIPIDHSLIQSARTTTTPHLAGTTAEGFLKGPRTISEILRRLLSGQEVDTVNGVTVQLPA